MADPTWACEQDYFFDLCRRGGTNLDTDIAIQTILDDLTSGAAGGARP